MRQLRDAAQPAQDAGAADDHGARGSATPSAAASAGGARGSATPSPAAAAGSPAPSITVEPRANIPPPSTWGAPVVPVQPQDAGGELVGYTQADIDAYTKNTDPDTINLTIDEFLQMRRQATGQDTEVLNASVKNTRTKLPNGRASLLVDLGSRINLIGDQTLDEEFRVVAEKYGLEITKERRSNRLHVSGVGAGTVPCDDLATIPIAVRYQDTVQYDSFVANVAQNSRLPAILGARSMQEKDAVILLREGHEKLIFPGKEGYTIKLAKDAKIMPITPSASGHMHISCDHYDQATKDHGIKGKGYGQQTVFTIDYTNVTEPAGSSNDMEARVMASPAAAAASTSSA